MCDGGEVVEVISERILAEVSDSGENGGRKRPFLRQFPEPVLHRFGDRLLHSVLHRPEFKRTAAVRVCNIENMEKNRSPATVPDECDAVCASVDPSVQAVPHGNLGAEQRRPASAHRYTPDPKTDTYTATPPSRNAIQSPLTLGDGFHRLAVQIGDRTSVFLDIYLSFLSLFGLFIRKVPPVHLPHGKPSFFGYAVNIRLLRGSVIQFLKQIAPPRPRWHRPETCGRCSGCIRHDAIGRSRTPPVFGDIPLGGIVAALKAIRKIPVRNQGISTVPTVPRRGHR